MLEEYIYKKWDDCIMENKTHGSDDIPMPHPYVVPCPTNGFREMYYWDTYFTCVGLILSDRGKLAKNSVDDILYVVDKFGFMPNATLYSCLNRSQPPYLSMMVKDIYDVYKDKDWLKSACDILKKEYCFWQNKRMSPNGLNHYDVCPEYFPTDFDYKKSYVSTLERIGKTPENNIDYRDAVYDIYATGESGWDFSPRSKLHQRDYNYVDLNCNLYIYEKNFAEFSKILGIDESEKWEKAAKNRMELINKILFDGNTYYDYDYKEGELSNVFSAAAFWPLWAKCADDDQAKKTVGMLGKIECEHGIAACENVNTDANYQWAYPYGWAPVQHIVIEGLLNYGYTEDAKRIAKKYTAMLENEFERTEKLWEKYDVVTGAVAHGAEYSAPEMLGWTAGTYLYAKNALKNLM